MNCKDFENWLLIRDIFTDKKNSDVKEHLERCEQCKNLYIIDTNLEENIELAFHLQELPKGLCNRLDSIIDHAKKDKCNET